MTANPAARPSLVKILYLAGVTPIVAFILARPVFGRAAIVAAGIAFPTAAAIGVPALYLALARGWRSFGRVTLLGTLIGPVPFLAWGLVVAFADMSFRPSFLFVIIEALSAVIGAASGAIFWLLVLGPAHSVGPGSAAVRITAVLAAALLLVYVPMHWPERVWPKFRERRQHLELAWDFGPNDSAGAREVRVWNPDRPGCVGSVYLPDVTAYVDRVRPATLPVDIVRVTSSWRLTNVRVDRIGTIVPPSSSPVHGCMPWRNGTRR